MPTWTVDLDSRNRMYLRSPYVEGLPAQIKKTMAGARWSAKDKLWKFPLCWESCVGARELANRFDAELRIGPALNAWATAERKRRESIPDVAARDVLPMTRLAEQYPHTAEAIKQRGFQTVGATFMATNRSALNADQPGLGKTLQTISAVVEAGVAGPILVVAAPKSAAVITWPNELKKWAPNDKVVLISGTMKPAERVMAVKMVRDYHTEVTGDRLGRRVWVITSPGYVRFKAETDSFGNYKKVAGKKVIQPVAYAIPELLEVEWSTLIVDEAHKTLAGVTSTNRKKWPAQRVGLDLLRLAPNGLRIALSGTPFRGREYKIWGILNWLRPDLYSSGWRWVEKHFSLFDDEFGGRIIGDVLDREKFYQELRQVMVRRTKEEVVPEMPPKMYAGENLDADDPNSPCPLQSTVCLRQRLHQYVRIPPHRIL